MAATNFQPGQTVLVLTAYGDWIKKEAVSGVVRGYDFPVVWVKSVHKAGLPVPWPAEDVRPIPLIS
jgi:hypothetical protein